MKDHNMIRDYVKNDKGELVSFWSDYHQARNGTKGKRIYLHPEEGYGFAGGGIVLVYAKFTDEEEGKKKLRTGWVGNAVDNGNSSTVDVEIEESKGKWLFKTTKRETVKVPREDIWEYGEHRTTEFDRKEILEAATLEIKSRPKSGGKRKTNKRKTKKGGRKPKETYYKYSPNTGRKIRVTRKKSTTKRSRR